MLALGLVETRGLVGAVEAADAMLKAADVHLLEKSLASGGLVTITVAGEVSAVQAAVDAAASSLARIPGVVCVSRHVIPRPDVELEHVLRLRPAPAATEEAAPAMASDAAPETHAEAHSGTEQSGAHNLSYDTMSLKKLRHMAAEMHTSLTRAQIASADRKTLICILAQAARQEKE